MPLKFVAGYAGRKLRAAESLPTAFGTKNAPNAAEDYEFSFSWEL